MLYKVILTFEYELFYVVLLSFKHIYRGYYMVARGYEFYLRVFNSISHE